MKYLVVFFLLLSCCLAQAQSSLVQKQSKEKSISKEFYENGTLKAKGKMIRQTRLSGWSSGRKWRCAVIRSFNYGRWVEYYPNSQKKRVVWYGIDHKKILKSWSENGVRII